MSFTWQEERRLTINLTLHYKRVMYIVEPSATSEAARGKQVLVIESEDGRVRIEYRGTELAAPAFPKDARVSQAAVVENKVLSSALLVLQAKQEHRDRVALEKRTLTLRSEDHLRKALGESGQRHGRDARERAPNPPSVRDEDLALKASGAPGAPHRRPVGRPTIAELARRRIAAEAALPVLPTAAPVVDQLVAQTLRRLEQVPATAAKSARSAKLAGVRVQNVGGGSPLVEVKS